jgi:hypothetical protein
MKDELWLIWKEPNTRRRYKIGILIKENNLFKFNYVNPELDDAKKVGFKYFPGFDNLTKVYESEELFQNILTRLPNKKRPDYLEILNCYNLEMDSDNFEILKATRGRNITDNYEFVPAFDPSKIEFEVAGTSHCKDIDECKKYLRINKKLYLEPEPDNIYDKYAIKIIFKEDDKFYHLGYVPRYYCKELLDKLNKKVAYSAMIQSLNLNSKLSDEIITANVKLILNIYTKIVLNRNIIK